MNEMPLTAAVRERSAGRNGRKAGALPTGSGAYQP